MKLSQLREQQRSSFALASQKSSADLKQELAAEQEASQPRPRRARKKMVALLALLSCGCTAIGLLGSGSRGSGRGGGMFTNQSMMDRPRISLQIKNGSGRDVHLSVSAIRTATINPQASSPADATRTYKHMHVAAAQAEPLIIPPPPLPLLQSQRVSSLETMLPSPRPRPPPMMPPKLQKTVLTTTTTTTTITTTTTTSMTRRPPRNPSVATQSANETGDGLSSTKIIAVMMAGGFTPVLDTVALNSQEKLLGPIIKDFGLAHVHLVLCVHAGQGPIIQKNLCRAKSVTNNSTAQALVSHGSGVQRCTVGVSGQGLQAIIIEQDADSLLDHSHRQCYQTMMKTRAFSTGQLSWIVRSRYDMTFFEDVPTPLHLDSTTVYGRARRIGQGIKNVETEMLSTWDWTDTCGEDAAGWDCFWVDDRTAADSSGQCLLIDDQFALIPAQFAAAYFTTSTEIQPKHKHFSIPQFDEDGAHDDPRLDTWETCDKQLQAKQPTQPSTVYGQGIRAEVELTCRLLAHEAQLGLLRHAGFWAAAARQTTEALWRRRVASRAHSNVVVYYQAAASL